MGKGEAEWWVGRLYEHGEVREGKERGKGEVMGWGKIEWRYVYKEGMVRGGNGRCLVEWELEWLNSRGWG